MQSRNIFTNTLTKDLSLSKTLTKRLKRSPVLSSSKKKKVMKHETEVWSGKKKNSGSKSMSSGSKIKGCKKLSASKSKRKISYKPVKKKAQKSVEYPSVFNRFTTVSSYRQSVIKRKENLSQYLRPGRSSSKKKSGSKNRKYISFDNKENITSSS